MFRHNDPPGAPVVENFVLDLGLVFHIIQLTVPQQTSVLKHVLK